MIGKEYKLKKCESNIVSGFDYNGKVKVLRLCDSLGDERFFVSYKDESGYAVFNGLVKKENLIEVNKCNSLTDRILNALKKLIS